MQNHLRVLLLLPVFGFAGCGGGDGSPASELNTSADLSHEFVLGHGESIDVGPLSLEFLALVDDSRCGIGGPGVCAWEGNGQILVNATNGRASQVLILNSNPKFPTTAVFAGYVIELRRLDPQPAFTTPPALDEYAATLLVNPQN